MHDAEMKFLITSKFSLLNKTQIEKFNYFSANSIVVDASNEEKFAFKNSLKLSKIIDFINSSLKTHAVVYYEKIKLSKY